MWNLSFSTVTYFVNSLIITYFISIPRLSINLTTSVMHTAVVEKYRSPDGIVLVYRSATVYVAATSVITVRQYSLKTTLTFSEKKQRENFTVERIWTKLTGHYCCVTWPCPTKQRSTVFVLQILNIKIYRIYLNNPLLTVFYTNIHCWLFTARILAYDAS